MNELYRAILDELINLREYKLAFRFVWMEYKLAKVRASKARHNRKVDRVTKQHKKLHDDISETLTRGTGAALESWIRGNA